MVVFWLLILLAQIARLMSRIDFIIKYIGDLPLLQLIISQLQPPIWKLLTASIEIRLLQKPVLTQINRYIFFNKEVRSYIGQVNII